MSNGPFLGASCPYSTRFQPRGRDHVYEVCDATGEEPLIPSRSELGELCHGDFTRCAHYQAARARDVEAAGPGDRDKRAA